MNKVTKQIADSILNDFFLTETNKELEATDYCDFMLERIKHYNLQPVDMGEVFAEWRADPDPIRNLVSGNVYQIVVEDMGEKYKDTRSPELRSVMYAIAIQLTIDSRQAFKVGATSGLERAQ
jgi:hypothetical protein